MRGKRFLASPAMVLSAAACVAPAPETNVPTEIAANCTVRLEGEHRRIDLTLSAAGRPIPVSLFAPAEPGKYKLIAFSHGAFAAPERYSAMLGPLAASGYVVIAPMHVDSEEMDWPEPPSPEVQWRTRNEDMAIALAPPDAALEALAEQGIMVRTEEALAMGHSFGALMAQFAGGAQSADMRATELSLRANNVAAVVAWSPPGEIPGRLDKQTWDSMAVPSLTLTGTADILPGFIDEWEAHRASYDFAPEGSAALWVGEGIDHYFGGVFGRVKEAPGDTNQALFSRALATALHFIESHNGTAQACGLGLAISGENFEDTPS